jgi:hypothetical protein
MLLTTTSRAKANSIAAPAHLYLRVISSTMASAIQIMPPLPSFVMMGISISKNPLRQWSYMKFKIVRSNDSKVRHIFL